MSTKPPIPAAQYVRMSTEDQQLSISNQKARIHDYAEDHGFNVVKTYEDPGRSGVVLKRRKGLSALLGDVISGDAQFKAILVYDVSRWGRFQNPDEAAYYEFICANSGIPLHYCAEQFSNDGTASSSILKALKRSMAAEFSRELGEKVFRGKNRLAEMGFWMGGPPGYGYRRRIVSGDGKPGRVLKTGQQKNLKSDRIALVLGPRSEVEGVRRIFSLAASGRNCTEIVRTLNREHISIHGREWNDVTVLEILTNPKYIGTNVWNRRTKRLHTPLRRVDPQYWVGKPEAFPPIVSQKTFDRARSTIQNLRDSHWSAERVLKRMRRLLEAKGRLSEGIMLKANGAPCSGTIRRYFGSYRNLYNTLNYKPKRIDEYRVEQSRRSSNLRKTVGETLRRLFPRNIEILLSRRGARSILRIDHKFMVSILFCRQEESLRKSDQPVGRRPGRPLVPGPCWGLIPVPAERQHITLLCLLNKRFDRILDLYLVACIGDRSYIRLRKKCDYLHTAIKLRKLEEFYKTVTRLWQRRQTSSNALL